MRERLVNFSLVYFFALIVALGYILNVHRTSEAEERKRKVSKEKISFKYNNATIVSDSSICYIGQTSNYIFLYNRMDSSTSIFNLNNCDSITIKGFKN